MDTPVGKNRVYRVIPLEVAGGVAQQAEKLVSRDIELKGAWMQISSHTDMDNTNVNDFATTFATFCKTFPRSMQRSTLRDKKTAAVISASVAICFTFDRRCDRFEP